MAYTERRARKKGVRYRGMYKDADGRYKSAGTYDTDDRALQVAVEAEKRAAELIGGAVGGLDPVTRAPRTIEEYAPVFMRHHPFHDVKTPKVPGQRAIKIATAEQYLAVRGCLPTKPAKVFST